MKVLAILKHELAHLLLTVNDNLYNIQSSEM